MIYFTEEKLWECVSNTSKNVMVMIDENLRIRFLNNAARLALNVHDESFVGEDFFDVLSYIITPDDRDETIIAQVFKTGQSCEGFIRKTHDGRYFSMDASPMRVDGNVIGVLLTGADITDYVDMHDELDRAFSLMLPDTKVEFKLKTTIEYQDEYIRKTGKVRITGRMIDGGYRHVINCLRIFSILRSMGITKVVGIEKDIINQAIVFHDLGKTQPVLNVGDEVDPSKLFEGGAVHAFRSADLAESYYDVHPDALQIIRYHHHSEEKLPEDFPSRLLPAWRLFQLIDGISAAITRVGISVQLNVFDCTVQVNEIDNPRPQYNGTREIDLYSGRVTKDVQMLPSAVLVNGRFLNKYTHERVI